MSAEDAQFIGQRAFSVEEVARIFGVPPHLLAQTEKQTSWGTGVAEQNLGLARYTLMPWTSRIEQSLSRLLPTSRFVEFDYAGLLQGTPTEEVALLKTQIDARILTPNEARRLRNLPPLPDGDGPVARIENENAEE
jgi:HK97 family phage portal protein